MNPDQGASVRPTCNVDPECKKPAYHRIFVFVACGQHANIILRDFTPEQLDNLVDIGFLARVDD